MVSKKSGFSLVEVLIASVILVIISYALGSSYFDILKLFSNQSVIIEISTANRIALDQITATIRQAETVVNSCTCEAVPDVTGPDSLILKLWPINAQGQAFNPADSVFDYIIFKQDPNDSTKLIRKSYTNGSSSRQSGIKTVSAYVSSIQFIYDIPDTNYANANEITTTLTTTSKSGPKTLTNTQSRKASLRNK